MGGLVAAVGECVGCGGSVVGCVFVFFLFFCFGGCDSSGCGLIFMGCDRLMLVGGDGCGLIFGGFVFLFCLVFFFFFFFGAGGGCRCYCNSGC